VFREPGGTPIGEEIRHTLKHSHANAAMTREAELLLMNASRAQLVREVIRPALAPAARSSSATASTIPPPHIRVTDDNWMVRRLNTSLIWLSARPDPTDVVLARAAGASQRGTTAFAPVHPALHSRSHGGSRPRLLRARRQGYEAIAAAEPQRIKVIPALGTIPEIQAAIWRVVAPLVVARRA
jgi:dTMP kinase